MQGSRIYSDFSPDIAWIRREVARDVQSFAPSVQPLARFYTEEKLKVTKENKGGLGTDQRMSTPIPYLAFWFADALGLTDERLRRQAGLSLACSSIAATIRDDMVDAEPENNPKRARLAEFWHRRHLQTLRELFPPRGEFRMATVSEAAEWRIFKDWQVTPLVGRGRRPFSAGYLSESSRYYVACALSSLIAVAHAAGRKRDVPRIESFLREFSMGWRIFDDLMDWEADLSAGEMNRSSVLLYVWNKMGRRKAVDRVDALGWFMTNEFVEDAYGAMIGFFLKAQRAVAPFGNYYLECFMKELIELHRSKRDSLLILGTVTLAELNRGLTTVLGPGPRLAPRNLESLSKRD